MNSRLVVREQREAQPVRGPRRQQVRTLARALGLALVLAGSATVQGGDAPAAKPPVPMGGIAGVLCVDGEPTPGTVEVRKAVEDGDLLVATGAPMATVKTAAHGGFAVDGLAVGAYEVRGRPTQGATAWSWVEVPGALVVTVPLQSPGGPHVVRGRVYDVDGTPFRGWVSLVRRSRFVTDLAATVGSTFVETDAEGHFVIPGVATGAATLAVAREGYRETLLVNTWFPAEGPLELRAGAGDRRLRGRAIGPDGAPVPRARVRAVAWLDEGLRVATADADGRFEVRVPEGCEAVVVGADGFLNRSIPLSSRTDNVTARLVRGTTVSGVVRAADRRPVEGIRVVVAPMRGSDASREWWSTTGADGRYVVDGVAPGEAWVFAVGESLASPALANDPQGGLLVVVPPAGLVHDLIVAPASRARVRVRDETGAPVALARVEVRPIGPAGKVADLSSTRSFVGGRTGPTGTFELDTILPGSAWRARVFAQGAFPFDAPEPTRLVDGTVVVDAVVPAPTFHDVEVVTETGEPVRGASLGVAIDSEHWRWDSAPRWRWISDAMGSVRVGPVPAGRALVTAEADGFRIAEHGLLVAGGVTIVRMVAAPGITGVVRGPAELDGRPVTITFQRNATQQHSLSSPEWSLTTRVGFRFRTGALDGDAYEVTAEATGADGVRWKRSVQASVVGEPIVVELERRPDARLVVVVVDTEGVPVPAARAIFVPEGNRTSIGVGVWAGEARIEVPVGVRRGRLVVRNARDDGDRPLPLAAYEGDPIDLDGKPAEVTLVPERPMSGRVVDAAGHPVAGVAVRAHVVRRTSPPDIHVLQAEASATTDEHGEFRLHGLAARGYRIEAMPPDGYAEPEPTLIDATAAGPLSLTVRRGKAIVLNVLDPEGAPVPRASVMLWWRSADGVQRGHRGSWMSLRTDDEGRVRFDGILVGRDYQLQVSPPDTRTDLGQADRTRWVPDDTEIRLQRRRAVSGVVLDEKDRPVAMIEVAWRVVDGDRVWMIEHADAEGRFTLPDLPPGPIEVTAGGIGGDRVGTRVEDARDELVLRVDASRSLRIRIKGILASGAVVRLGGQPGEVLPIPPLRASISPGSPVRWTDLRPAGRYALYVGPFARGGCYYREGLAPGGGDVVALEEPGVVVRGLVAGAREVHFAHVGRAGVSLDLNVGADGRFATPPLPVGTTWTLTVFADGGVHTKDFVVAEGKTIDLRLSR